MKLKDVLNSLDSKKEGLRVLSDEDMQIVHCELLSMLADFDAICKENDITWWLAGGSILGAVRHKGFIPWDDDVDIHLTRKDYEKLQYVFQNNASPLTSKYLLKSPGDKNFLHHHPKVYKKGTIYQPVQSNDTAPNNLWVDIFVIEDTPDSSILRTIHAFQCTIYLFIVATIRTKACEKNLLNYTRNNKDAQKEIKKRSRLAWVFSFRSLESWLKAADKCFSKVKNPDSKFIVIPSGALHYKGEIYDRELMCEIERAKFETLYLPIPKDADRLLKQRYGEDYMRLPPSDKRMRHSVIRMELNTVKEE